MNLLDAKNILEDCAEDDKLPGATGEEAVQAWRDSAAVAGDEEVVLAIDTCRRQLGWDKTAVFYEVYRIRANLAKDGAR